MTQLAESIDEVEQLRQQCLTDLKAEMADEWEEVSAPGSFGCHELLDRTGMLMDTVDRFIAAHPACVRNKEWFALAQRAVTALTDLYQKVGADHV